MRTSSKYYPKLQVYKNSSRSFKYYPRTCTAYSYDWWKMLGIVEGKIVFNCHQYSVTTSAHQRHLRELLRERDVSIDIELDLPQGINSNSLKTLYTIHEASLNTQKEAQKKKSLEKKQKARERYMLKKIERDSKTFKERIN